MRYVFIRHVYGRAIKMSVLVAYDGRNLTKKALDYAIKYTKAFDTTLYIFSAITSKDLLDRKVEITKVKKYTTEAKELAMSNGVKVEIILESGNPGKGIIDTAERFNVEEIVVGRSDKSFFDRAVLGSVSEYVLSNATNFVVIVVQ